MWHEGRRGATAWTREVGEERLEKTREVGMWDTKWTKEKKEKEEKRVEGKKKEKKKKKGKNVRNEMMAKVCMGN